MINAARNLVKVLILGTSHIDVHAMRCGRIASVLLHNAAGNKFVYAQEALLLPKNGSEESQKDDSDTEEVLEKTRLIMESSDFKTLEPLAKKYITGFYLINTGAKTLAEMESMVKARGCKVVGLEDFSSPYYKKFVELSKEFKVDDDVSESKNPKVLQEIKEMERMRVLSMTDVLRREVAELSMSPGGVIVVAHLGVSHLHRLGTYLVESGAPCDVTLVDLNSEPDSKYPEVVEEFHKLRRDAFGASNIRPEIDGLSACAIAENLPIMEIKTAQDRGKFIRMIRDMAESLSKPRGSFEAKEIKPIVENFGKIPGLS